MFGVSASGGGDGTTARQDNLTEHAGEEGKIDQPLEADNLPFGSHEVHVIALRDIPPGPRSTGLMES